MNERWIHSYTKQETQKKMCNPICVACGRFHLRQAFESNEQNEYAATEEKNQLQRHVEDTRRQK